MKESPRSRSGAEANTEFAPPEKEGRKPRGRTRRKLAKRAPPGKFGRPFFVKPLGRDVHGTIGRLGWDAQAP